VKQLEADCCVVCHGVGAEVSECELKCLAVADVKQLEADCLVVCHGVGVEVSECELKCLAVADVKQLEADCFWCFSKLLDGIQDYYTFAQPGIQKRVNSLKDLVSRIDSLCRRIISRYV